jgi:hypothetical protein
LDLLVQLSHELRSVTAISECSLTHLAPVLQTDLEHLSVVDRRDLDQVKVGIDEQLLVIWRLDQAEVRVEVVGEEEGEVVNELLVLVIGSRISGFDVYR